jgi:hypothetical protein
MRSPLIIIPSAPSRPVVDRCRVCKAPFYEGESRSRIEAHLRECVKANHDRLMEARRQQHPDIMRPWDTEHYRWIRKNGAAILEGRLKP